MMMMTTTTTMMMMMMKMMMMMIMIMMMMMMLMMMIKMMTIKMMMMMIFHHLKMARLMPPSWRKLIKEIYILLYILVYLCNTQNRVQNFSLWTAINNYFMPVPSIFFSVYGKIISTI